MLFALPLHLGCVVDQSLGERDAATTDTSSTDSAAVTDRDAPADGATTPDDASVTDRPVTPPDDVPIDAPARTDDVPARTDDVPADAPTPIVRRINIGVVSGRTIPALGTTANLSVAVSFDSADAPVTAGRLITREGDCLLEEAAPTSNVPARSLGPLRITATPEGGAPITLTASPRARGPWVIEEYGAALPQLAPGTRVRVEVPATASSAAVTRDVVVSDTRYAAPTPVTENATARYLTWTRGAPLAISWERLGGAATTVGLTFNLFTTSSEAYALRCTSAEGAPGLTVPASVMMALYNISPSMGVGGVSNILTAGVQTLRVEGGVTVAAGSGSYTMAGLRW